LITNRFHFSGKKGNINVKRNDRDYLLSIKNAEFEYDDLVNRTEVIKEQLNTIFDNSNLKERSNLNEVNKLLISIRETFYLKN
jgi:hypothetical protein